MGNHPVGTAACGAVLAPKGLNLAAKDAMSLDGPQLDGPRLGCGLRQAEWADWQVLSTQSGPATQLGGPRELLGWLAGERE